jgi:hypothetical protein
LRQLIKLLDKISGYCFLLGFFTSRLRAISSPLIAPIIRATNLASYLVGYAAWYISSLFSKASTTTYSQWYSYKDSRKQQQIAGVLGLMAAILCIIYPLAIIPTSWLYTLSNIHWLLAERNKMNSPSSTDPTYSTQKQTIYCYYAACVTIVGLITALTTTLIFLFPLMTTLLLPYATYIGLGLSILSAGILAKHALGTYPPDPIPKNYTNTRYIGLQKQVGDTVSCWAKAQPTVTESTPQNCPKIYSSPLQNEAEKGASLNNQDTVQPGLAA